MGAQLVPVGDGQRWLVPPMTGAAPDTPMAYPLAQSDPNGTEFTIDSALNDPTRITRDIAQIAMQRFYMDRLMTPAGGVEGGALMFERAPSVESDLYATRKFKVVEPMEEAPVLAFQRGIPMMARPRKLMGKFYISKEARKRNKVGELRRSMVQTANTLTRQIELLGLAEADAVVAAENRFTRLATGVTWRDFAATRVNDRLYNFGPVSDIMTLKATVDAEERGHNLNSAIINPLDALLVVQAYPTLTVQQVFASAGIPNVYETHRQRQGTVRFFEAGAFGEWRNEFPLDETVWVEERTDNTTWYQWSISPLFAVIDQFAYLELRNVNG